MTGNEIINAVDIFPGRVVVFFFPLRKYLLLFLTVFEDGHFFPPLHQVGFMATLSVFKIPADK